MPLFQTPPHSPLFGGVQFSMFSFAPFCMYFFHETGRTRFSSDGEESVPRTVRIGLAGVQHQVRLRPRERPEGRRGEHRGGQEEMGRSTPHKKK